MIYGIFLGESNGRNSSYTVSGWVPLCCTLAKLMKNLILNEVMNVSIALPTCRNNSSISNFGDGFRWQSEYPQCVIQVKSTTFSNSERSEECIDFTMM
ncbi:Uncharacterized protein FWK35_00020864, partial [Aphis craccivora]